jgi:hypothetical protein
MHTMLKTGAVAATLIAAAALSSTPSEARCYGCAAAGGFVAGAAVGAIAASAYNNNYGYGYGYGYAPGYAYYGGPGYAYYGGPGYAYGGGPAYYDSYAYAPRQSYRQYRDGTGYVAGTNSLSDR